VSKVVRLSISLEESLFEKLEQLVEESRYGNRSEFVRDMIRDRLVELEWERDEEVVGTLTLLYDHHARLLSDKLMHLQHHHHETILATTHVHLDSHMCVEVSLMRGRAGRLREIADLVRRQKGVLHAVLSIGSTGVHLD